MESTLTPQEIRQHLHPELPHPGEYRVVRLEVDVEPDSGVVSSIALTFRSSYGDIRRVLFIEPQTTQHGPFQLPPELFTHPVYVVDIKFLGWELGIEVGSMTDEMPTFFFAKRIETSGP